MNQYKVFIIILNWNGKEDTLECLDSVQSVDYPNYDTVVVDNGSSDESVKSIRKEFLEVKVIETGKNLGFAGGNNVGIRYALGNGADYILILNNDTIVDPQLLKAFIKVALQIHRPVILSPKIYYFSNRKKIWYAGGQQIKQTAIFKHIGIGCNENEKQYQKLMETDYASGCAFFADATVFRKVGLFDETFFLTYEETDFCYRAKNENIRSYVVPEAKVWHKISVSFGGEKSPMFKYFLTRNRLLWAERHLSKNKFFIIIIKDLYRLIEYILPISIKINRLENKLSIESVAKPTQNYRNKIREKYQDPLMRARFYGIRDYFLRRFGSFQPNSNFSRKS
jgi:GT2 family glycosyltransferase